MKTLAYKTFSKRAHSRKAGDGGFSLCEFELTFSCGLHCRHCYSDCYNTPEHVARELDTAAVKKVIREIRGCGAPWLCFTGGDPLMRKDFPEIYSYAKAQGFLITVFTNAYSFSPAMARLMEKRPPFCVEVTVNGADPRTYERITGVPGSFGKAVRGLERMVRGSIPLRIKAVVTRDNAHEIASLRAFLRTWTRHVAFDFIVLPRLNGDTAPCALRVPARDLVRKFGFGAFSDETCRIKKDSEVFACAVEGGEGIRIDPYGRLVMCVTLRTPAFDVLSTGVGDAYRKAMAWLRSRRPAQGSACRMCRKRAWCESCPGKALLETGEMELPVPYYCELADHMAAKEGARACSTASV